MRLSVEDPRVVTYLDWLVRWNPRVPLVSRRLTRAQIEEELLMPVLRAVEAAGEISGELVDLGAGSGMGGVAFALANAALRVSFVERIKKKAAFIKQASNAVGLGHRIRVFDSDYRAVEWGPAGISHLYLRAVGGIERILMDFRPFIAPGGKVFLLKARGSAVPAGFEWEREIGVGKGLVFRIGS